MRFYRADPHFQVSYERKIKRLLTFLGGGKRKERGGTGDKTILYLKIENFLGGELPPARSSKISLFFEKKYAKRNFKSSL